MESVVNKAYMAEDQPRYRFDPREKYSGSSPCSSDEYSSYSSENDQGQIFRSSSRSPGPPATRSPQNLEGHQGSAEMENDKSKEPSQKDPISEGEFLPDDIKQIIGDDPHTKTPATVLIHQSIASRWSHILRNGIPRDELSSLLESLPVPSNLPELSAPKLNPEISEIINNPQKTKDSYYTSLQDRTAAGLSALAQALSVFIVESENLDGKIKDEVLPKIWEAGRIFASLFHRLSMTRRSNILPSLHPTVKKLVLGVNPSDHLFGENLAERIKAKRGIEGLAKRPASPTGEEPYPGSREVIRKAFQRQGIPESALNTTLNSLSEGTIRQYGITYKAWWSFCESIHESPFNVNSKSVILFFEKLLSSTTNRFNAFNSHRAALSLISDQPIGRNMLVKRYLKGIFRQRPPAPRYQTTWDPQIVLDYLETTTGSDLKAQSFKLVTLLTLATGQRLQTISTIRIPNITMSAEGARVRISDFIKTTSPNSAQPCLHLPFFDAKPSLCAARCLQTYIELTKDLRSTDSDKLFVCYKKPHKPATKQTLSRWVKETLTSAGVDTTIFKPHSTRHASTSAADRKGLAIECIRKTAGWTSKSTTFAKFYKLPLAQTGNFLHTVFDQSEDN
ncbi:unnamed protein product [Nesidiocoris tenuis]|uniref:Tyr recombinase domain-containing protein n=1 Tax=Nesidiocoris tenuis TaxID=355587 RepID=A0A6H5GZG4_9HEMI|nr:unnamed protein product [Nesidiocoris tenuis]